MIQVKVKICGITNLEDAAAAARMGADILGFNFYPKSPRYIDPKLAGQIIQNIPTHIDTAAVFVNARTEEIHDTLGKGFFNWVQLHGDEDADFCRSLRWTGARIIKAVRVRYKEDVQNASSYPVDAVLLDAWKNGQYGGTGKRFEWSWIDNSRFRVFLAGGINPENAAEAMGQYVYGIDVCSGIESQPGRKDHEKMNRLFENIRTAAGLRTRL
jgi:phosphoribosylanthranilate isomerase